MKISEARLEAATRAVAKAFGFEYSGERILDEVDAGHPRVIGWRNVALAAINARPKRKPPHA